MLLELLGAAIAGGVAALAGKSGDEIALAAIAGAGAGWFAGAAETPNAPQAACLADTVEYLVVTGEVTRATPQAGRLVLETPNPKAGRGAAATLQRCNPKRAYYDEYQNQVIVEP